jgi:hypothetical protein
MHLVPYAVTYRYKSVIHGYNHVKEGTDQYLSSYLVADSSHLPSIAKFHPSSLFG